jgi:hypothetical protein
MAGSTMLGYTNHWLTGVASSGSSTTGFTESNLQTDQCSPSTGWQTADGVVTSGGGATLRLDDAGLRWQAFALVQTNLTSAATVRFKAYLTSGPTLVYDSGALAGPVAGYAQVVVAATQEFTADYLTIDIDDAANPDNHINIGGAFAGAVWQPTISAGWNTTYGSEVRQTKTVSRGGQQYRSLLSRSRFWKIELESIRDAEAWTGLGELDRIASLGSNVLMIPNYTSSNIYYEAVYGPLDVQSDVSFPSHTTNARLWRGQITERL